MKILSGYPLSPMQQGMLFHSTQEDRQGYYIEQVICNLRETLNVSVLIQSWQQVLERHSVLRTSFSTDAILQLRQQVHEQVDLSVTQHDLQGLPNSEQNERLTAFLWRDRQAGFDMTVAPLMRLAVFQREGADYTLVWTFHHALLDGRSIAMVLQEVFALYDGKILGQKSSLPDRRPYQDYIAWLEQQSFATTEPFWQNLLRGFTQPTRFANLTYEPASGYGLLQTQLSQTLSTALTTLAQPRT
ncbi:MAG: hypothetical protein HC852_03665 [Acaryochloridaceae cyanobacterium RU_4_10]|nr:hypothetical protein [Acaryochloridaceae cyanobacterium RU_4_10]